MVSQDQPDRREFICDRCARVCRGEARDYRGMVCCEDCYLDVMMPRKRKTHWQYLSSIKSGYLIEK